MKKDFDRWNGEKKILDQDHRAVEFHEREIWWCSIGVNVGSEQHSQSDDFSRPVVIVRRFTSDVFWSIPLTTKVKEGVSFRVRIVVDGVPNDALVLQMRAHDRKRLKRKIGVMTKEDFNLIIDAIAGAF